MARKGKSIGMEVEIMGVNVLEIAKEFPELYDSFAFKSGFLDLLANELVKTARQILQGYKGGMRHWTGRLYRSIGKSQPEKQGKDVIVHFYASAPYASIVEFGTGRQPFARPFMYKAFYILRYRRKDLFFNIVKKYTMPIVKRFERAGAKV